MPAFTNYQTGFEEFSASADMAAFGWNDYNASTAMGVDSSYGRFGKGFGITAQTNARGKKLSLNNLSTGYVGFAIKPINFLPAGGIGYMEILVLRNIDNGLSAYELGLFVKTSGVLEIRRGGNFYSGGTVLGTTSYALSVDQWTYVELKWTIHNTTGVAELRLNGVTTPVINFSGDTAHHGTTLHIDELLIGVPGTGANSQFYYDDFYVNNTGFLGDVKMQTLVPTGAGNHTQFTPSTGSNWQNVDEGTSNGDTDYNESSTLNHRDSFVMGNLAAGSAEVKSVAMNVIAKKTDGGARSIQQFLRISGSNYDESDEVLTTSYTGYQTVRTTSPATAAAFTPSEVDGLELGVEISV